MGPKTTVYLRLDTALAARLKAAAEEDRRSLNGFLEVTLQQLMDMVDEGGTVLDALAEDVKAATPAPPAKPPAKPHWENDERLN